MPRVMDDDDALIQEPGDIPSGPAQKLRAPAKVKKVKKIRKVKKRGVRPAKSSSLR